MGQFERLGEVAVSEVRAADPITGYRTRAKFVADASGALGLFLEGTHDVLDLPGCVVLDPRVEHTVSALRELLRATPVLEGVDVVCAEHGTLVTLIAAPEVSDAVLAAFADALCEGDPSVLSVAASRREAGAVQLLGRELRVLRGPDSASRRLAPDMPAHSIAHGGFVQAHDGTAQAIQRAMVHALQQLKPLAATRVLEIYAGAGALSLWLASQGARVTSIEAFKPACARLERTAQEQNLTIDVIADDAAQAVRALAERGALFDAVVVNPPRRGLDPRVRKALADLEPDLVLYVSCNPETLARDLSHLASLGLSAKRLVPFDMMPLTYQVETLAVLERGPMHEPVVLHEDASLLALHKPPHLAFEDDRDGMIACVHARPGWEQAVLWLGLREDESGVVLFARDAAHSESMRAQLMHCKRSFRVLAKGVTHGAGRLARPSELSTRYKRLDVVGGHSLLEVTVETLLPHAFEQQLSALRHPVIGSSKRGDRRTYQHFSMRHGLDRPFIHCADITLVFRDQQLNLRAPNAPDLALALQSLREA